MQLFPLMHPTYALLYTLARRYMIAYRHLWSPSGSRGSAKAGIPGNLKKLALKR